MQQRDGCHREVALLTSAKDLGRLHELYADQSPDWKSEFTEGAPHALHVAVWLGLDNTAEKLLAADKNIAKDSTLMRILCCHSIKSGNSDVFEVLDNYLTGERVWTSEASYLAGNVEMLRQSISSGNLYVFKALYHRLAGERKWTSEVSKLARENVEILRYLLHANDADPLCHADYQEAMRESSLPGSISDNTFEMFRAAGVNMDTRTGHPVHNILASVLLADATSLKRHLKDVIDPRAHRYAFRLAIRLCKEADIWILLLNHGIGLDYVDEALVTVCRRMWTSKADIAGEHIELLLRNGASDYHAALDQLSRDGHIHMLSWLLAIATEDINKAIISMLKHR
jgi:hypothetical protein